jgi:hypothetical protein
MPESYPEFLARVHRQDVEAGKPVMHKPGVCETCDAARKDADSDDVQR